MPKTHPLERNRHHLPITDTAQQPIAQRGPDSRDRLALNPLASSREKKAQFDRKLGDYAVLPRAAVSVGELRKDKTRGCELERRIGVVLFKS